MHALHPDAEAVIRALSLEPHPEGGYYREVFRSLLSIGELPHVGGKRSASTSIYYLLPAGAFSALHVVQHSDEVWHHYAGDPVDLHTIDRTGLHALHRLGSDVVAGERPQHVVPGGTWQAAIPRGARFALLGCTVAPGFDFLDFEMPAREDLLAKFPLLSSIVELLTRPTESRDTIKMPL